MKYGKLENGYLPIIETHCPLSEEGETTVYTCHFERKNDAILQCGAKKQPPKAEKRRVYEGICRK